MTTNADPTRHSAGLVELSSRLLFSLLKPAVRTAARFRVPVDRLVELTKLAYFEELRAQAPRDLDAVARAMSVSYRTAVNFNRATRGDFFKPEKEVEPLRLICGALVDGPKTVAELVEAVDELDADQIHRQLALLTGNGWVRQQGRRYTLQESLRSWVSDDLARRVDGLNNLMSVLSDTVWSRFVDVPEDGTSVARTWVFAADPDELAAFVKANVRRIRHEVVDIEESALAKSAGTKPKRYGVMLAVTPIQEEDP